MRTLPAGMATELAKQFAPSLRVHLFDIQRGDGQTFFWSDMAGVFLSRLTGSNETYMPWIKTPPDIQTTRSVQANAGQFTIQNLSGNAIERDLSKALVSGEFEGAYVVYRRWLLPVDGAAYEFHGSMSEASDAFESGDVTFRILQLMNFNDIPSYDGRITRACGLRFTSPRCGYRRGQLFVPLTTATVTSASTIGAASLAMTPNLYANELVMILSGTGAGQERYILSHTATTFTLKTNWTTNPDSTSKFIVTGPGTMKVGATTANVFSASSIGNSGLTRTTDQDIDSNVYIVAGTGAGQNRRIASNTATTYSVAPNWTTVPDGTSKFVVVYKDCPKDRDSCVTRGVTESFNGVIFIQPAITSLNGPTGIGTGGGAGSGGGGPKGNPIGKVPVY